MLRQDWHFLSPYIRFAQDSYIDTKRSIVNRTIYDFELLFLKEGEIRVETAESVYAGKPGDIFFFRPNQPHSIHFLSLPYVRQPHIHFDFFYDQDSKNIPVSMIPLEMFTEEDKKLIREDFTKTLPFHMGTCIRLKEINAFEKLLFEIIHTMNLEPLFYEFRVKGLFFQLWMHLTGELYAMNYKGSYQGHMTANRAREFLTSHTDREITLDELASRFNINKYHLVKIFKSTFGESPIHFHLRKRIEQSQNMLRFTSLSVAEIAEKTGFHSLQSFSRAFKNYNGAAPIAYRKRHTLT